MTNHSPRRHGHRRRRPPQPGGYTPTAAVARAEITAYQLLAAGHSIDDVAAMTGLSVRHVAQLARLDAEAS